jgi:hypothetical protein
MHVSYSRPALVHDGWNQVCVTRLGSSRREQARSGNVLRHESGGRLGNAAQGGGGKGGDTHWRRLQGTLLHQHFRTHTQTHTRTRTRTDAHTHSLTGVALWVLDFISILERILQEDHLIRRCVCRHSRTRFAQVSPNM